MQLRIPGRESGLRRGGAPVPTEQPVAVLGQLALGHFAGQLRDGLLIITRDRPGDAEGRSDDDVRHARRRAPVQLACQKTEPTVARRAVLDRKSTRLNSSHLVISYAVFCLKKKKTVRKLNGALISI